MNVEEFIINNYENMKKHNLDNIFIRKTTPTVQIFFLLKLHLKDDEDYWSCILTDLYNCYKINASADDDRYWKKLGGSTWGYIEYIPIV